MIRRFIFVVPKPAMEERDFFRYWKEVHAPLGAAIPGVLGYRISTRLPLAALPATHPFLGAAEVWIEDAAAALGFVRSSQYIERVRPDEPKWLAFWRMVALDTAEHVLARGAGGVKVVAVVKRRPGLTLEEFRSHSLDAHAALDRRLPGLRRYEQCHVLDALYEVGEPPFDCVSQLWFDDIAAAEAALMSAENAASAADLGRFADLGHAHAFLADEAWVVRPGAAPTAEIPAAAAH